jgi:hypothetical protein
MKCLFMDNNFLVGTIPTEVGLLTELRKCIDNRMCVSISFDASGSIYYYYYLLVGPILFVPPPCNTRWNNNMFSGSLPTEFGQLSKLRELWFHRLLLTGTILSEIVGMVALNDFRVHSTGLEGNMIPDMLYQHSDLGRVELSNTKLGGTISTEIGNLSDLNYFRIRDCQLHGTIPTEKWACCPGWWRFRSKETTLRGKFPAKSAIFGSSAIWRFWWQTVRTRN